MIKNAEVIKGKGESTPALIRRFTRKVKGLGLVKHVRSSRYAERDFSRNVRRKQKIKKLNATARYERMRKLGKI